MRATNRDVEFLRQAGIAYEEPAVDTFDPVLIRQTLRGMDAITRENEQLRESIVRANLEVDRWYGATVATWMIVLAIAVVWWNFHVGAW